MSAAPIVLYIGGLDRSGSTLLANIFDAIDGCISIGEFHTFWKQGFQENWRSSDGHAFHDSPFWQQVLAAFGESYGDYDPAECARITDDVQSRRHKLPFQLGVLGNTAAMTDADRDYARIFHHLYLAISKVSGDRILVDSGKQAYHPFVCAAGSPETDLRIAHLIRDSRAVAYSRQRVKPNLNVTSGPTEMARFSPQYMSARWLWQNGLLGFSKKRVRAYTRVLYTELTRQPMQEFDRMVQALELPIPAEDYTFLANRTFMTKPGVAFSGNPHRFDFKETKIRPDDAWRSEMKTSSRTLVTAMTWPMLRYYGM